MLTGNAARTTELLDGDVIDLGIAGTRKGDELPSHLVAHIGNGRVRMVHGGEQTADLAIEQLSAQQIAGLLAKKVEQAGMLAQRGSTGRVKV